MDKALPYGYSSLPLGSTRLLCKYDDAGSSTWSLTQHVLGKAPAFFALSYVWGTEKTTERLVIEQSVLEITPSLSILLHQLEARRDVRFIWIDQICINQQNDVEKAVQVKMMRDIYASAHKVLAWLGPSTKGSDLAMDSIPPLDEAIGVLPQNPFARENINSSRLPGQNDAFWPALVDLSIPWASFASFKIKLVELLPPAWILACHPQLHRSSDAPRPGDIISKIAALRRSEAEGSKPPFWQYLSMGQKCKVTNPLDRVYGLLGLLASEELIHSIEVRYDWEPRQGYLHFCKVYIERDPDLALFSLAGCVSKPKELPSWCPNFDSTHDGPSLYCRYPGFRAGFKPGGPRYSQIQTSATSNTITAPGFRMDRVKAVTKAANPFHDITLSSEEPRGQATKQLQYHFECLVLFIQVYPAQTTDDCKAFFRSLVAGHLTPHVPLPAIAYSGVHRRMLEFWTAFATGSRMPRLSASETVAMERWMEALSMQANRRFFITESGRMGIGSGSVEKGDHVCVFYSAGPFFLLRYVDADAPAELVGDAYVDGLMELENIPDDTRGEDEVFAIC